MRFCYAGRVKIFLLLLLSFPAFAQSPSVATLHQTIQIGNAPYDAIITRPSTPASTRRFSSSEVSAATRSPTSSPTIHSFNSFPALPSADT